MVAVRAFITIFIIIAVLIGAAAIYLAVTTPDDPITLRFPLGGRHRAALALVPESAEAFAYFPRAAAFEGKVRRNPIARQMLDSWTEHRQFPQPWMLGKADVIVFHAADRTRFLLRLDPVRAVLVRLYLVVGGDAGETILINAPMGRGLPPEEIALIEALAAKLPPGDALVVQRRSSRTGFPPIGRPAVSSVSINEEEVLLTSRARAGETAPAALPARVAKNAMLSASFASPPRIISDLNRILGARISDVFSGGGSVALYDIDTRKLLPRPLGVLVVPASDERRATLAGLRDAGANVVARADELVVSFDDSLPLYLKEEIPSTVVPGGKWTLRIDAQRIAPILDRLKDHVGLRIASGRTFRAVRNLREWISTLQEAKTIEATDSADGEQEELKVRISTK